MDAKEYPTEKVISELMQSNLILNAKLASLQLLVIRSLSKNNLEMEKELNQNIRDISKKIYEDLIIRHRWMQGYWKTLLDKELEDL